MLTSVCEPRIQNLPPDVCGGTLVLQRDFQTEPKAGLHIGFVPIATTILHRSVCPSVVQSARLFCATFFSNANRFSIDIRSFWRIQDQDLLLKVCVRRGKTEGCKIFIENGQLLQTEVTGTPETQFGSDTRGRGGVGGVALHATGGSLETLFHCRCTRCVVWRRPRDGTARRSTGARATT